MSKIKLMSLAASVVAVFASQAALADGTVTFTGSIINEPCSISPNSVNQIVPLGAVSLTQLQNGTAANGASTPQTFTIQLLNCNISSLTNKTVTTTFTGSADTVNPSRLGITGSAAGAGVVIKDGAGTIIPLGTASNTVALGAVPANGSYTLSYSAYLQGDGVLASLAVGTFTAVANYTLNYQ